MNMNEVLARIEELENEVRQLSEDYQDSGEGYAAIDAELYQLNKLAEEYERYTQTTTLTGSL